MIFASLAGCPPPHRTDWWMDTGTAHPREVNFYFHDEKFPDIGIVAFRQKDGSSEDAKSSCIKAITACRRDFQYSYNTNSIKCWLDDSKQPRAVAFHPEFILFIISSPPGSKDNTCDELGIVIPSRLVFEKQLITVEDVQKQYMNCLNPIEQYINRPRPASVYQVQDFLNRFKESQPDIGLAEGP